MFIVTDQRTEQRILNGFEDRGHLFGMWRCDWWVLFFF